MTDSLRSSDRNNAECRQGRIEVGFVREGGDNYVGNIGIRYPSAPVQTHFEYAGNARHRALALIFVGVHLPRGKALKKFGFDFVVLVQMGKRAKMKSQYL